MDKLFIKMCLNDARFESKETLDSWIPHKKYFTRQNGSQASVKKNRLEKKVFLTRYYFYDEFDFRFVQYVTMPR